MAPIFPEPPSFLPSFLPSFSLPSNRLTSNSGPVPNQCSCSGWGLNNRRWMHFGLRPLCWRPSLLSSLPPPLSRTRFKKSAQFARIRPGQDRSRRRAADLDRVSLTRRPRPRSQRPTLPPPDPRPELRCVVVSGGVGSPGRDGVAAGGVTFFARNERVAVSDALFANAMRGERERERERETGEKRAFG